MEKTECHYLHRAHIGPGNKYHEENKAGRGGKCLGGSYFDRPVREGSNQKEAEQRCL